MISPILDQILEYAIPIGCGLGAFCFAIVLRMGTFLKKNMNNGDGRTLRRALDDLCLDFAEHRHEIRANIQTVKDDLIHETEKVKDELVTHTDKDDIRFKEMNDKLDQLMISKAKSSVKKQV